MDRVNFGVRNIFNIAIIGDIEQLMKIKEWIEENRGMCELGYICVEGIKPPGVCYLEWNHYTHHNHQLTSCPTSILLHCIMLGDNFSEALYT